jgi:hypothetical protein
MYGSLTADRGRALQEIIDKLIEDGNSALHAFDAPHRRGMKAPSVQPEKPLHPAAKRAGAIDQSDSFAA